MVPIWEAISLDGYQRRTLGKKVKIIQAAVNRLGEAPESVTISSLASEAVVSPVSIYNYFGSKEALLQLAVLSYVKQYLSEGASTLQQDAPFDQKLQKLLVRHANALQPVHPGMLEALKASDESFESRLKQLIDRETSKLLDLLIGEGVEAAVFQANLDPERLKNHLKRLTACLEADMSPPPDFELLLYGFIKTT